MIVLLRAVARTAALVLLGAASLAALAVAIASVGGWDSAAGRLELESAPRWAADVERGAAWQVSLALCLGALAVAAGALLPRRSRRLVLRGGTVTARRRAVRDAAAALAGSRGAAARVRVRVRRRRLDIEALFPPGADARSGVVAIERSVHELATSFDLRVAVRARLGEKGARVR